VISKKIVATFRPLRPLIVRFAAGRKLIKYLKFKLWQLEVHFKTGKDAAIAGLDVHQMLWVDPERIKYQCVLSKYDTLGERGQILGGNWDKNKVLFSDLDVYRAFKARFINNEPWENTDFYHRVTAEIASGNTKWGCTTLDEFNRRLEQLEALYTEIKENGYKSQQSLFPDDPYRGEDEISIRIGRDGELLFEDGRHRLTIAKLLKIEKVPVKVTVRHREWVNFRMEILKYAEAHNGKVYQPLLHPDLETIPSHYGPERYNLIRENLDLEKGTLLDIGAHWGYFCHRFEDDGFDCYAVESDLKAAYFLEMLKKAENKQFTVINQSIFNYTDKTEFDIVLALNIFHHFLKTKETYIQLKTLLQRLRMKMMFFQAHEFNSVQMQNAYRDFSADEFVEFILRHSELDESRYLGKTSDGRRLYKLYKSVDNVST